MDHLRRQRTLDPLSIATILTIVLSAGSALSAENIASAILKLTIPLLLIALAWTAEADKKLRANFSAGGLTVAAISQADPRIAAVVLAVVLLQDDWLAYYASSALIATSLYPDAGIETILLTLGPSAIMAVGSLEVGRRQSERMELALLVEKAEAESEHARSINDNIIQHLALAVYSSQEEGTAGQQHVEEALEKARSIVKGLSREYDNEKSGDHGLN